MFRFCPACASEKIRFEENRIFRCSGCGFTYYHNTAAAAACIVRTGKGLLFLVRQREPGRGKLDLPGGFVDPGEGALGGLHREFNEELGLDISPEKFKFFASFPNTYPYKNILYNTCDLFFFLDAPDLTEQNIFIERSEISSLRFIKPEKLCLEEIAFESVKKALRVYLDSVDTF
ncbi:MAG: NUDIX domain-containing protein [Treponema sp.]|jgi:ADP-ribose pyrophosphatase YjhB (NUDIX family)|nr:NUDIX domain-containing protein [Treponema sp.]